MYMYTTYAWQYTIKTKQENAQFQYALLIFLLLLFDCVM